MSTAVNYDDDGNVVSMLSKVTFYFIRTSIPNPFSRGEREPQQTGWMVFPLLVRRIRWRRGIKGEVSCGPFLKNKYFTIYSNREILPPRRTSFRMTRFALKPSTVVDRAMDLFYFQSRRDDLLVEDVYSRYFFPPLCTQWPAERGTKGEVRVFKW